MIKKILLVFVLTWTVVAKAVPLKPYVFNNDYNHLSQYYQYIEDCNTFASSEVLQQFNAGNFKTQQPNVAFSSGISTCNYWLAVNVVNQSDQYHKFLWSFYNNGLSFELYELVGNKLVFKGKSSMHLPLLDRPFPVRTVSFPFYLKQHKSTTLFAKVSPTISKNVYFPIDITTPEDFLIYEVDFSYLLGKYFGALLFVLFVNFCMFFIIKERLYLYTILYTLCIILFQLSDFHFDSFEIPKTLYGDWSYVNKDFFIGAPIHKRAKFNLSHAIAYHQL